MTIKLHVVVEPVGETAKVTVVRERGGEPDFQAEFVTLTSLTSPAIDVEPGDRLQIALEAAHKITYDKDQFSVGTEEIAPEVTKPHKPNKPAAATTPKHKEA